MIFQRFSQTLATLALTVLAGSALTGCSFKAGEDNAGYEYAPDMYYSIPYDPYSQLTPNTINPDGANIRRPAVNTVPRQDGMANAPAKELSAKYPFAPKDLQKAANELKNPLPYTPENIAKGKYLYTAYCYPCHGVKGDGNGPVGEKYGGVANYKGAAYKGMSDGHIYHVIVHGKGRMWPHGTQILPQDRWLIVQYVNKLRGLNTAQADASQYEYSTFNATN